MLKVKDIRSMFKKKYDNDDFIIGYLAPSTVELIAVQFVADEDFILRPPNEDYVKRELEWYLSQSLNVNDIPGKTPKIWKAVATEDGLIHSNYGWCIFSDDNYNQYNHCLNQLKRDKLSRRAIMIYTRPAMQVEYNRDGMSDFMCTNNVQVFIRKNQLIYGVYQRSCDAIFGFNNDLAWHKFVYDKLYNDLLETYPELNKTDIIYHCGSLHVYETQWNLIEQL